MVQYAGVDSHVDRHAHNPILGPALILPMLLGSAAVLEVHSKELRIRGFGVSVADSRQMCMLH